MTHKRANSSVEYRNLDMLSSIVLYNTARKPKVQQEYIFHPQEIGKTGSFGINHCPLCFASGLWQAHIPLLKIVIGLCHKKPTGQNHFYTERKVKKQAFQRCLWERFRCSVSPRYGLLNSAYFKDFIEESAWKFRRFFFCGILNRRKYTWMHACKACLQSFSFYNHLVFDRTDSWFRLKRSSIETTLDRNDLLPLWIHESKSTRTLLSKASKLNMYINNIHLYIFPSSLFRQ